MVINFLDIDSVRSPYVSNRVQTREEWEEVSAI